MPPQSDDNDSHALHSTSRSSVTSSTSYLFQSVQDVWDSFDQLALNPSLLPTKAKVFCYQFQSDSTLDRVLHVPGKKSLGKDSNQRALLLVTAKDRISGITPDLTIRYNHHNDFVNSSNGKTSGMQLAMSGKMKVIGDHKNIKLLAAVTDAARQEKRRSVSSSDSNSVATVRLDAKSDWKVRRSSMTRLLRIGSIVKRNKGSYDEIRDDTTSSNDHENGTDGYVEKNDDIVEPSSALVEEIAKLQAEKDALSDRCSRLEAQNVLVASQQLDILARSSAIFLSMLTYYLYVKMILKVFPIILDGMIERISDCECSQSMCDSISTILPLLKSQVMVVCLKFVMATLPYIHHKFFHGLTHRRFEVFAVAFIIMARIKLTRARIRMFIGDSDVDDNNQSSWRGDTADSLEDNDDALNGSKPPAYGESIDEDAIWEANYEISARFLYTSILRIRGLWTKSAQYLSSRADFMPIAYVRELGKLMDEAPETPWDDVKKILLRSKGLMDQLDNIGEKPIASASIGQVHVATIKKTGEKVVVKVQHPFARSTMRDDFLSLKIIASIVTFLEPEYKFFEILMREWAEEAKKELNFDFERANLETARASVKTMTASLPSGSMLTDVMPGSERSLPFRAEIPRPYHELSDKDVLVMSFCEGKRVDDMGSLKEWNLPRYAVMNGVAKVFAHMMYVTDIFNGDPHPGNIFVRPGTGVNGEEHGFTVVVLDWGLAKRLPQDKRIAFCQLTYSASTLDFGLMLDAFDTMGLKMKREDVAEDMEGTRHLLRDMAPRSTARKRIKAKMKTDMKRFKGRKKGERVPMESKSYPGEFFFFVRTNELLHGLGSKLGIEMSYLDVLKPYAEQGLGDMYERQDESNSQFVENDSSEVDLKLESEIEIVVHELDKEGNISGAQVCVVDQSGNILADKTMGNMGGLKRKLAMRSDSVILGFSCTKAVVATLAHLLVEQGYLTYDEPICERVWPAFCPCEDIPEDLKLAFPDEANLEQRWIWKRSITLRHALTHTAGFSLSLPAKFTIKSMSSCEECCKAYEYDPNDPGKTLLPKTKPGDECAYHFMSFGWLVAGTLMGAYKIKTGITDVTFEEVYNAILAPKLSEKTKASGFRPCGGSGSHPMAHTDSNLDLSSLAQLSREAEARGESLVEDNNDQSLGSEFKDLRESFRGKEWLLDPRVWNCSDGQRANVPAAGGRFSAKGLALFYHELGAGLLVSNETLETSTQKHSDQNNSSAVSSPLQAPTDMSSLSTEEEGNDQRIRMPFGLGYQLISFESNTEDFAAFGHSGVGGSLGFYHKESGCAVAIMLNKAGTSADTTIRILRVIAKHMDWKVA